MYLLAVYKINVSYMAIWLMSQSHHSSHQPCNGPLNKQTHEIITSGGRTVEYYDDYTSKTISPLGSTVEMIPGCLGSCLSYSNKNSLLPHSRYNTFCNCVFGKQIICTYEPGFAYDPISGYCDVASRENCTSPTNSVIRPIGTTVNTYQQLPGCRGACPDNQNIRFAHTDWNKFCQCIYGQQIVVTCAPGVAYDPTSQFCDPATTAYYIPRNISTITQTEWTLNITVTVMPGCYRACPKHENIRIRHTNYNQFCQCIFGYQIIVTCAPGMAFDTELQFCDPANKTRVAIPGCRDACPAIGHYHFPHTDCNKYCHCTDGKQNVVTCQPGESYDLTTQFCGPFNAVNCYLPTSTINPFITVPPTATAVSPTSPSITTSTTMTTTMATTTATTTTTAKPTTTPTTTATTANTMAPTTTPTTTTTMAPTTRPTTTTTMAPTTKPTTARTMPPTTQPTTARTMPPTTHPTTARTMPPTTQPTTARTIPTTVATTTPKTKPHGKMKWKPKWTKWYGKKDGYWNKDWYGKKDWYWNKDWYGKKNWYGKKDWFGKKDWYGKKDWFGKKDWYGKKGWYGKKPGYWNKDWYGKKDGHWKKDWYGKKGGYWRKDLYGDYGWW